MGRVAGSIGNGAGRGGWPAVCGGLGGVAGSGLARDCVSSDPGESIAGNAAEGKQGGVRPDGHGSGDVQPIDLSAKRKPGLLVAGAAHGAVAVMATS